MPTVKTLNSVQPFSDQINESNCRVVLVKRDHAINGPSSITANTGSIEDSSTAHSLIAPASIIEGYIIVVDTKASNGIPELGFTTISNNSSRQRITITSNLPTGFPLNLNINLESDNQQPTVRVIPLTIIEENDFTTNNEFDLHVNNRHLKIKIDNPQIPEVREV